MEDVLLSQPVFIAITIGLTEVVKRIWPDGKRFLPLFALLFGIMLAQHNGLGYEHIIEGLIIGLSAMGLFSATKNVIKK